MKKRILAYIFLLSILTVNLSACGQSKRISDPQVTQQFEQQSNDLSLDSNNLSSELTPSITPEEIKQEEVILLDNFSVAVEVTHTGMEALDFELLQAMGVKYIRFNGILWSEIQPTENSFLWDGILKIEEFFQKANQYGMTVIPIVRGTPVWAQKVYGFYCGAIQDEKLPSFGVFMETLVNRYKSEEYNIHYWEIWNEPDVQPEFVKNTSQYGCWGDGNDPYYGGGNYANMLKIISPIIKDTDNSANILIGGLLLDCDPKDAGAKGRCQVDKDLPPKFLEGILMNGGGEYFDIVSFHGYTSEGNFDVAPWVMEENFPNWSARGGVIMGKYNYIQELLSGYGYDKPVFLTETGYLCSEKNITCGQDKEKFYYRQSQYGIWLLVRNWIEGVNQSFWYSYNGPGWRDGGILNKEQQPKPVYSAIQILNQRMVGAQSAQKLKDLPDGLQGYAINFEEKITWVVVSADNDSHVLDLSADNDSHVLDLSDNNYFAYDAFNKEIQIQEGKLEIFYPVYVDIIK